MSKKSAKGIIFGIVAVILIVIMIIGGPFKIVPSGNTGVVITLGHVDGVNLTEGLHTKKPFIQSVYLMNNRIQKLEVHTEAFSRDLQSVDTNLAVNYFVEPQMSSTLYQKVGSNYETILIEPATNEVLKAISAKYTAEESVSNRELISDGLVEGMNAKLNDYGIHIVEVNIINFDFSEDFINAIEQKQVAQQHLLQAETEKKQKIVEANAEAESMTIRANAEAEANRIISESLTDGVIQMRTIEKWDGKLPVVHGGVSSLIDMTSVIGGAIQEQ